MSRLKTQLIQPDVRVAPRSFGGLLAGLEAGPVLSWGLLEVVSLRLDPDADVTDRLQFAAPEEHLKLVDVPVTHQGPARVQGPAGSKRLDEQNRSGIHRPMM